MFDAEIESSPNVQNVAGGQDHLILARIVGFLHRTWQTGTPPKCYILPISPLPAARLVLRMETPVLCRMQC